MAKVGKLKEKIGRLKKKLEAGKEKLAADKERGVRKQIKRAQRRSRTLVKMEARAKKQAKKEEGAAPPASA
jgi:hypothetical protein